jgi:hypothetical protein
MARKASRLHTLVTLFACLLAACTAACSNTRTASATEATSSGASQPNPGPIVIVVLADRYTATQQTTFEQIANTLFTHMFLDPDYAPHQSAFQIVKVFEPWTVSTPSNYGFQLTATSACHVSWIETGPIGTTTAELLDTAAGSHNPAHVVIVGNHGFNFGCTLGRSWTYISAGALGRGVLEHEFGHLIGELFDEYALTVNTGVSYPGALNCRNCSTAASPHWTTGGFGSSFVNQPPCDYFAAGIVHPSSTCKMAREREPFCPVCRRIMDNAIASYQDPEEWDATIGMCPAPAPDSPNPGPPGGLPISGAGLFLQPPTVQSIVRVLVSLDRQTGRATIQRVTEAKGQFVAPERRLGTLAYEVLDNGKLLAVGVIQGDPFQVRTYGGGTRHGVSTADTASVVVQIPNETRASLNQPGRSLQIAFYRLAPNVTEPRITRQNWEQLRKNSQLERLSEITPDEIRNAK